MWGATGTHPVGGAGRSEVSSSKGQRHSRPWSQTKGGLGLESENDRGPEEARGGVWSQDILVSGDGSSDLSVLHKPPEGYARESETQELDALFKIILCVDLLGGQQKGWAGWG